MAELDMGRTGQIASHVSILVPKEKSRSMFLISFNVDKLTDVNREDPAEGVVPERFVLPDAAGSSCTFNSAGLYLSWHGVGLVSNGACSGK